MFYAQVILFTLMVRGIAGKHAITWDSCGCHWESWKSWSDCTKTCGGGSQIRERLVWNYDTPECEGFETCASNDEGFEKRLCNLNCFHGGTIQMFGTYFSMCACQRGTTGSCCETVVTCGPPGRINNGVVQGTDFTYGHEVRYICDSKYNMTGSATRSCTEYGTWSKSSPSCTYAQSCESNPCKNGATCENRLGFYICICINGWTGKNCDVDIQPPLMSNCPSNRLGYTAALTKEETWTPPTFSDPMRTELVVVSNYENSTFEFPWGDFTVSYTATKVINGLQTECIFNISIRPFPCTDLKAPANGFLLCNGWRTEYSRLCIFACKTDHIFPPGFKSTQWYNCGASGHWMPAIAPVECLDGALVINSESTLEGSTLSDCNEKKEEQIAREVYVKNLKLSAFNSLCTNYNEECNSRNVSFVCS